MEQHRKSVPYVLNPLLFFGKALVYGSLFRRPMIQRSSQWNFESFAKSKLTELQAMSIIMTELSAEITNQI